LSQDKLTFYDTNFKKNPSLKILKLKNILNENGFILINALNEILVQKFLEKKITFPDITNRLLGILNSNLVKNYLKNHQIRHINDVFKVYNFSRSLIN
jgi:1-deoxy-D-xylulose 5-phosphate reductoisomerase